MSLEQFVGALKKFYQQQDAILLLIGGSLSIEDHYVALAVITSKERKEKEEQLKQPDLRFTTYETIFQPKEPIQLEKLFERPELRDASQKRVLIQGSAGIGKSILCQNIAYQWAQSKSWLSRFKAVFWLKFRDINRTNFPARMEEYTIYEVLASRCGFKLEQIEEWLEQPEFRKNCLLILDGYDEFPDRSIHFKPENEQSSTSVIEAFQKAFDHVIVTTRPQSVPGFKGSLELEILGFEDRAIDKYVESFFSFKEGDPEEEKEKKTKGKPILCNQLQNSLVRSLCHIPINLEIFCSLSLEGKVFPVDQPLGIAQIYDKLTNWLIKRFFKEKTSVNSANIAAPLLQNRKEIASQIKALEKLAWSGLADNRLYFSNTDENPEISLVFADYEIDDITDVTKIGPFRISDGEGQFIHLTFQEFFGAKYLARLFLEEKLEDVRQIVAEKKFDPRYQLVFSMTSGLLALNKDKETLQLFFNMLYESPRDLGGSRELILFARYFEGCGASASQIGQYGEFIKKIIALLEDRDIFLETKLELLYRNHFLLANDLVIELFLQKLEAMDLAFFYFLERLAEQKNRIPKRIIESWFKKISEKNHRRLDVLRALKGIVTVGGDLSEGALDKLFGLLSNSENYSYIDVVKILEEIIQEEGNYSGDVLERLQAWFLDLNAIEDKRAAVAVALGEITQGGRKLSDKTFEALEGLLSNPNTSVNTYMKVLLALVRAGKSLPDNAMKRLIALISNSEGTVAQRSSLETLGEIAQIGSVLPEEVLKVLVDLVSNSGEPAIQLVAIEALGKISQARGLLSERALQILENLISDSPDSKTSEEVCAEAAKILGGIAQHRENLSNEVLLKNLGVLFLRPNANESTYKKVLVAIVRAGGVLPENALDKLIVSLSGLSSKAEEQSAAAHALMEIVQSGGKLDKKTLDGMVASLSIANIDAYTRGVVAQALVESIQAGGKFPGKMLDGLADLFLGSIGINNRETVLEVLTKVLKVRGGSIRQIPKLCEILYTLLNHFTQPIGKAYQTQQMTTELLEAAVKEGIPSVEEIAMNFLYSMKLWQFLQKLEHIDRFLASLPIRLEMDKGIVQHICKKNGIAFYERAGQHYVAGEREVYSLTVKIVKT